MTQARARVLASEKGAVFVQVGISLLVLMAFNVFVLGYFRAAATIWLPSYRS